MIKFSFVRTAVIAASLVVGVNATMAQNSHSHSKNSHKEMSEKTVHHGEGKINSISENRTLNMTHGPIEPLGMPGMRMSFKVDDAIDLSSFKAGDKVAFNVIEGDGGWYVIIKMTKT